MRIFPKIIRIFENAFFSPMRFFLHIRILYVFQQNYTYLCVFFMRIFLALPRIIRFFSILKTGHHGYSEVYKENAQQAYWKPNFL